MIARPWRSWCDWTYVGLGRDDVVVPLARFTVLEVNDRGVPLCLRLATSLAGKIAADLGATVLKIEPSDGDPVRHAPPLLPQGDSALFQFLNTSKRSLALDLASDAGRASLARLLDTDPLSWTQMITLPSMASA